MTICNTEHAKVKSFLRKRHQSTEVKKDLIYVQMRIKEREIEKLSELS